MDKTKDNLKARRDLA
jgi:hypothetical protein